MCLDKSLGGTGKAWGVAGEIGESGERGGIMMGAEGGPPW